MFKDFFSFTLRTQLIISFMVIIILILVLGFVFINTGIIDIEKKRTEETTINQFRQMEYSLSNITNEVYKISGLIMIDQDVQDYISNKYDTEYETNAIQINVLDMLDGILSNYDFLKSIFIFKENGEIIGSKGKMTFTDSVRPAESLFFKSSIYKKAKDVFSSLAWEIGNDSYYFEDENDEVVLEPFISATRALKWVYGSRQAATLVININGNALSSIYKYVSRYKNSSMYIVDEDGKMLSNNDMKLVGKSSEVFRLLDKEKHNGSQVVEIDNTRKQIIYYKLQDFNWTFIQEVPLNDYARDVFTLKRRVIVILSVSILLAIILSSLLMDKITKPLKVISHAMNNMEMGQIGYKIDNKPRNEFGVLINRFNRMSKSIEELIDENKRAGEQKRILEIDALQSQINPHFLYNTLNSIRWMAIAQKADPVAEAVSSLGKMLVPVFKNKSPILNISEEINYVKNYIALMNLRYGDGIHIDFKIDEGILDYKIPKFILQPIVENSITHGFDNWFKDNRIVISGCEIDNEIELAVEDNGKGIDIVKIEEIRESLSQKADDINMERSSIGLANINSRLVLHFGEIYGLKIQSAPGEGIRVVLRIPKMV